jgi:hypothetical protein
MIKLTPLFIFFPLIFGIFISFFKFIKLFLYVLNGLIFIISKFYLDKLYYYSFNYYLNSEKNHLHYIFLFS